MAPMEDQRAILVELSLTRKPEDVAVFLHYFSSTRGKPMSAVIYIMSAFALILVILRLYARLYTNPNIAARRLRLDDWWILAAWFCYMVMISLAIVQFHFWGLGEGLKGMFEIGKPTEVLHSLYFGAQFYLWCMSFSKFSILALYWQVLGSLYRVRPYLIAVTWFLILGTVGCFGWSLFSCVPVVQQWDIRLINDKCRLKTMYELVGVSVFAAVSDVVLMLLSIPLLRSLRLPAHEKLGIFSMFALTIVTIAASTARTIVMVINQDLTELVVWGFVEASLCIIVACIPALRAMAARAAKKLVKRSKSDTRMKLEDETELSRITTASNIKKDLEDRFE